MLLRGLALIYLDCTVFVWSSLLGAPIAFMADPTFNRKADRQLPSRKYNAKAALLGGALTGAIAYFT